VTVIKIGKTRLVWHGVFRRSLINLLSQQTSGFVQRFLKGVVNLRGIIVPIIDMRIKFQLGSATYDQFTVVIILNVAGRVMGIVVDGVSDVITLGLEQMRPAPGLGSVIDTEYIMGLGTVDERMLILIDIEKMMSSSDMGLIEQSLN
ncbi:MAG: hypothetical protein DU481_04320, partial [Nitrosomonas sp.]